MSANRSKAGVHENPDSYKPISSRIRVLTQKQCEEFERRQAEPSCQPTPAECELVRMFHDTVKR